MFGQVFKRIQSDKFESLVGRLFPATVLIIFTALTLGREGGWLFTLSAYLLTTTLPSIHLTRALKRMLDMEADEVMVVNFIIGNGLMNLVYILLTTLLAEVSRLILMGSLIGFSLVTGLLTYLLIDEAPSRAMRPLLSKYLGVVIGVSPGVYTILKSLPNEYWRGDDPWGLAVVAKGIFLNGFSPAEAFEYYKGYFPLFTSGFYYHVAAIMAVTGAQVETLVRYGGAVIAGTLTVLTYIIVKRTVNKQGGIVAAFFMFLSPRMILRFSSPLREYYGYVVLILVLYLSYLRARKDNGFEPIYVLVQAGLLSATIVNHTLTPILVLGILGIDMLNSIVKGKLFHVYEVVLSFILAFVMAGPYYPFIYEPILMFFGIGESMMILLGAAGLGVFFGLLYLVKDRIKEESFRVSVPIKTVFLFLLATVFIVNVYYPPDLGAGYALGYMSEHHFSKIFALISIIGYFLMGVFETPIQVYSLAFQVAFFVGLSYLGVGVPLGRLEMYGVWVMCYASAQMIGIASRQFGFEPFKSEGKPRIIDVKNYIYKHRYTVLLLIIIMIPYMNDISHVRQAPYTYNSNDVKSAKEFAEIVEDGDLVVHELLHVHLMYYAEIPHESQINVDDVWGWKTRFYVSDTVYNMSDWVQETIPEVERVHFYATNENYLKDSPNSLSKDILEDYGYELAWDEARSFTFDIPFSLDSLPLENVRYIGNNGSKLIDDHIIDLSNVVYEPEVGVYRVYYAGETSSETSFIGYLHSENGVDWVDGGEILTGLNDPYIVKDDSYHMFALDETGSIVALESWDGVDWFNEKIVVPVVTGNGFWEIEAPIAWINGSEWNLVYSLTQANSMNLSTGLVHHTSWNGAQWREGREVTPILTDKLERHHVYEKILLTDRIEFERGVMFLGRFKAKRLYGEREWKTGSLWFPDGIREDNAYIRSFTYTDYPELSRDVHSVQYSESLDGRKLYLYTGEGEADGINLGFVDDEIGLEIDWIVEP